MTTGSRPTRATAATQPLHTTIADARQRREEAAALGAQDPQAIGHAAALSKERNAIPDSTAAITEAVLARRRIELTAPVAARFQTDESGRTGIELIVELADPAAVPIAEQEIRERFGGEGHADRLVINSSPQ